MAREGASDLVIPEQPVGAEKISGNALRVRRRSVLYHGTLLDTFPLELIGQLLRHPPREPEYQHQRSHTDFLTNSLSRNLIGVQAAVRRDRCSNIFHRRVVSSGICGVGGLLVVFKNDSRLQKPVNICCLPSMFSKMFKLPLFSSPSPPMAEWVETEDQGE